ncbi:hypothetical protein SAY86_011678 [Trapa natans]|uniref:Telomeric single stranded DNA binding POT1/Cdc13 domain-containing protein n=1 Tax=Trapa natans TaxID=22666 RepID=A0AAN7LLE8_TRANT|nr:hypothetical protein SAY86_011678 [Trapa natans]
MEGRDDYRLLKLRDAVTCLNQRVNLIGVVIEFGFPKLTRGTDYFISLKLVDESHSNQGIPINFFGENVEKLPFVASLGDIVQLTHVVMKTHDGEVYALFNKKFSSFALYEGIDGKDFKPYQVSARFSSRELDKKFIADLRFWLLNFEVNIDPNDYQLINEMKEGQRHNLVGKILHVTEVAKDELIVFLWDGTDAPKNNIQTRVIDEMNAPLPLHLEPESLSRDILSTFPPLGTILRVFLDRGNKNIRLGVLKAGQWINFANIICEVHAGLWRGVLMPFTKFRYISNNCRYALKCQRSYEERLSSNDGHVPWDCSSPSPITEVGHANVPFVSLMDVIKYPEVTAKFKCIVRVVTILPSQEEFFGGQLPTDMLRKKIRRLLGVEENDQSNETEYTVREPPWVACCLKSYYMDKAHAWESRQYQIFETRLL